jgi:hypothetical protein
VKQENKDYHSKQSIKQLNLDEISKTKKSSVISNTDHIKSKSSKDKNKRKSYSGILNPKKSFLWNSSSPRKHKLKKDIQKKPSHVSLSEIKIQPKHPTKTTTKSQTVPNIKRQHVSFSTLKRTEGFYFKKKKLTPRKRIQRQDSLEIYRNNASSKKAQTLNKSSNVATTKYSTLKTRRRSRTLDIPTISIENEQEENNHSQHNHKNVNSHQQEHNPYENRE